jgi:hypothetical protein
MGNMGSDDTRYLYRQCSLFYPVGIPRDGVKNPVLPPGTFWLFLINWAFTRKRLQNIRNVISCKQLKEILPRISEEEARYGRKEAHTSWCGFLS